MEFILILLIFPIIFYYLLIYFSIHSTDLLFVSECMLHWLLASLLLLTDLFLLVGVFVTAINIFRLKIYSTFLIIVQVSIIMKYLSQKSVFDLSHKLLQ